MKTFSVWVIIIIGIIAGWLYIQNGSSKANAAKRAKEETLKQAQQAQTQALEKAINSFAEKYNAVTDWKNPIDTNDLFSQPFTIEVQDALLRSDARPLLIRADILDIERNNDKYIIHLTDDALLRMIGRPSIEFVLTCSDDQIKKITPHKGTHLISQHCVVIANIDQVKKQNHYIQPVDDEGHYKEVRIDITDTFVATGHCIDLLTSEGHNE